MVKRPLLRLSPLGDSQSFYDAYISGKWATLAELLADQPALSLEPLSPAQLAAALDQFDLEPVEVSAGTPLYRPPGLLLGPQQAPPQASTPQAEPSAPTPSPVSSAHPGHPETLNDGLAVEIAYGHEIERVASFLRTGLSVLVYCDKLVVEHLWKPMAHNAGREPLYLCLASEDEAGLMPRGQRQRQIAELRAKLHALKNDQILVIPHLDLLAGGSDENPATEAREITELVYGASDQVLLGFADRSIAVPEVLAARFALRVEISGSPREVPCGSTSQPLCTALVTRAEAARVADFDANELYKNVSGMNPIRLRQAIRYAVAEHLRSENRQFKDLVEAIKKFKISTSPKFEVPDISFDQIGGYQHVKAEIERALRIMAGGYNLPTKVGRSELIPRGFIFHGPPGTGKTLFAKAIANRLNATILVVSGPEVTDMYVGESERKLREIFADARRNAPSVVVFDEFDSIAGRRSSRDDGGSRSNNAVVAQILTEMDGFRPDVPMLVIGTTNRLELIDDALLRPSRFQPIKIGLPETNARHAIIRVHASHFQIDLDPALAEIIADQTDGFNGDEIRSLFRDACVGLFCEDPPIAADAGRYGRLVGLIRAGRESLAAIASARGPARTRDGDRFSPQSDMRPLAYILTPEAPARPTSMMMELGSAEDQPDPTASEASATTNPQGVNP